MASMRNDSCPCARDELQQLFEVPDTHTAINKVTKIRKYPLTPDLNHDGPIEFLVNNVSTDFIDVANITLYLQIKVQKGNGNDLDADEAVGPVNNFMHSLFKDVKLRLGKDSDTLVTSSLPNYSYRAYLENLLSFGKEAKNNHLDRQVLWHKDTAAEFDEVTPVKANAADDEPSNTGLVQRYARMSSSKTIELQSRLHLDLFLQDRYLLDGVDLRLTLEKHHAKFFLMYAPNRGPYIVDFVKAYLEVPFITLAPTTYTRITTQLQTTNAKYPLKRVVVKDVLVPSHRTSHVFDNLFINEVLPNRLFMGLIANRAYNGTCNFNPFKFNHHQLKHIRLTKNGDVVEAYDQLDFNNRLAIPPYLDLLKRVGILNTKEDLDLTFHDYLNGYTLFCFDLTNDQGADVAYLHPRATGNLSLELGFDNPAPATPLNLLLFAEYDNVLEIDRNRQVILDW